MKPLVRRCGFSEGITSIRPQGQMALPAGGRERHGRRPRRGQGSTLTAMTPHRQAGGMWPHRVPGCRHRQGVRRGDQRGPPRAGYLHRQIPQRQGIYVPGVDAFLKERNPPEGYIRSPPSRVCWTMTLTASATGRNEPWAWCGHRDPVPGEPAGAGRQHPWPGGKARLH